MPSSAVRLFLGCVKDCSSAYTHTIFAIHRLPDNLSPYSSPSFSSLFPPPSIFYIYHYLDSIGFLVIYSTFLRPFFFPTIYLSSFYLHLLPFTANTTMSSRPSSAPRVVYTTCRRYCSLLKRRQRGILLVSALTTLPVLHKHPGCQCGTSCLILHRLHPTGTLLF